MGIATPLLAVSRVWEPSHTLVTPETVGGLGRLFLRMLSVSIDGGQAPLLIVQVNEDGPSGTLERPELGLEGVAIVPPPVKIAHKPEPIAGRFPLRLMEESHMAMSGPAKAGVGGRSRTMVTVSLLGGQTPLVIDQMKTLVPAPSAEMFVLGPAGVAMLPEPENKYQSPVPIKGALPETEVLVPQSAWLALADAGVGVISRYTATVSLVSVHGPLVMVQVSVVVLPATNPVNVELNALTEVTVPGPVMMAQVPVPYVGEFPAMVAVPLQTLKLLPALAIDGLR